MQAEELRAVIGAAGLNSDQAQVDQLLKSITKIKAIQRFTSNGSLTVPAGYPPIGYGHVVLTQEQDQLAADIRLPRLLSFYSRT
ncbi:hypothetical protein [Achromobacter ruhlandii]|uniref:hypothetical protein n=1 Tax=Achromobacter ruhlandii TaxID=72557 RepID=UPI0006C844E0|nr:hypothetical protein [Achromobacter ruhlandii]AMG47136.1 hypothetical protein AL520_25140 [Achromobacter xylosoxidans]